MTGIVYFGREIKAGQGMWTLLGGWALTLIYLCATMFEYGRAWGDSGSSGQAAQADYCKEPSPDVEKLRKRELLSSHQCASACDWQSVPHLSGDFLQHSAYARKVKV